MHGRDGRVPGGFRLVEPCEEAESVEAGAADDGGSGGEGGQQRGHEAVDVEKRHHVETAVRGRQRQGATDVGGRDGQIALAQGHDLWPRRGAGCVQDQRDVLGFGEGRSAGFERPTGEREGHVGARTADFEPRNVVAGGRVCGGGVAGQRDQDLRVQVVHVEAEFVLAIGRVQGRCRRAGGDREEGQRHLGAVGQHDGDAVAALDAGGSKLPGQAAYGLSEVAVGNHGAIGRENGRGVSFAGLEQVDHAFGGHAPMIAVATFDTLESARR